MSDVEETIERIKMQAGIEGYVICGKDGEVLRRFPGMSQESAEKYAQILSGLTYQARSVVRNLRPTLNFLRIRSKRHEIIVATDDSFSAIAIQRWDPATGNGSSHE